MKDVAWLRVVSLVFVCAVLIIVLFYLDEMIATVLLAISAVFVSLLREGRPSTFEYWKKWWNTGTGDVLHWALVVTGLALLLVILHLFLSGYRFVKRNSESC